MSGVRNPNTCLTGGRYFLLYILYMYYYILFIYYLFIYISLPVIAPPIDAPSAAHGIAPAGPAIIPIAPPTIVPTVEPMLLLSGDVPFSPVVMSVNTHEQSYVRYMILVVISFKL